MPLTTFHVQQNPFQQEMTLAHGKRFSIVIGKGTSDADQLTEPGQMPPLLPGIGNSGIGPALRRKG